MTDKKYSLLTFLTEFGNAGGSGNAWTADVLTSAQLNQDPERDEKEKKKDRQKSLEKEITDALSGHAIGDSKDDEETSKETNDSRVLKMLKNLLFHEPGYEYEEDSDDDHGDHEGQGPDVNNRVFSYPSDNDHETFHNGKQIMDPTVSGDWTSPKAPDPLNSRKSPDYIINRKTGTVTDGRAAQPEDAEDKHAQLVAAIKDLKDELRRQRGNDEPHVEQEEDHDEEDQADDTTQFANAQKMFQTLVNQKMSRAKIISNFEKNLGVTNSTAVSYYQRLAKDAGLTNSGERELPGQPPGLGQAAGPQDMGTAVTGDQTGMAQQPETNVSGVQVPNDPNRQGLIRTVKGAHLVFKRKNEEGTFDELWVFGTGDEMEDALKVRRNILAGTDIPPRSTKSANGAQSYTLNTMGNGQILHIKGLPN